MVCAALQRRRRRWRRQDGRPAAAGFAQRSPYATTKYAEEDSKGCMTLEQPLASARRVTGNRQKKQAATAAVGCGRDRQTPSAHLSRTCIFSISCISCCCCSAGTFCIIFGSIVCGCWLCGYYWGAMAVLCRARTFPKGQRGAEGRAGRLGSASGDAEGERGGAGAFVRGVESKKYGAVAVRSDVCMRTLQHGHEAAAATAAAGHRQLRKR